MEEQDGGRIIAAGLPVENREAVNRNCPIVGLMFHGALTS